MYRQLVTVNNVQIKYLQWRMRRDGRDKKGQKRGNRDRRGQDRRKWHGYRWTSISVSFTGNPAMPPMFHNNPFKLPGDGGGWFQATLQVCRWQNIVCLQGGVGFCEGLSGIYSQPSLSFSLFVPPRKTPNFCEIGRVRLRQAILDGDDHWTLPWFSGLIRKAKLYLSCVKSAGLKSSPNTSFKLTIGKKSSTKQRTLGSGTASLSLIFGVPHSLDYASTRKLGYLPTTDAGKLPGANLNDNDYHH